jgi:hypothetical protein
MGTIVGPNLPDNQLNAQYFGQRQKYTAQYNRPQAMVWANNAGFVESSGYRTGASYPWGEEGTDFIITSDHNRGAISVDQMRIENRVRMVNGNMRSYHTADKVSINVSWNLLPSRANERTQTHYFGPNDVLYSNSFECPYTADGGAGGVDLLEWYNNTIGPMWVFLSYDSPANFIFNGAADPVEMLKMYPHRYQMFFSSFNYSVEKRGMYDMWNVSVSLEEA